MPRPTECNVTETHEYICQCCGADMTLFEHASCSADFDVCASCYDNCGWQDYERELAAEGDDS